jgi:hypothetical protein
VADVGEDELLAMVFPILATAGESRDVTVGPGDDAAVLALGVDGLVATTDAVVRGRDWRDEWSTAADVGAKVAAQNLADVAATARTRGRLRSTGSSLPVNRIDGGRHPRIRIFRRWLGCGGPRPCFVVAAAGLEAGRKGCRRGGC